MKVYLKKLHPNAEVPKQATDYAGGWDMVVTEIVNEPDGSVECKLGFALQLPPGYMMRISPRSSLTKTDWVMQNSPGLCDPDYFGEYRIKFRKLTTNPFGFPYNVGDRVGQCWLEKIIPMEFEIVEELNRIGNRDDAGYGTTGGHNIHKTATTQPTAQVTWTAIPHRE